MTRLAFGLLRSGSFFLAAGSGGSIEEERMLYDW